MKLRFPQTQIVRFNRTSPSLPLTLSSEVTLSFYNYSTKLTFRAYSWFYYYLIKIIIWIFKRSYHRKGVYNEYETGDILPPPIEAGASWDVSANADIITRLSPFAQWFYMLCLFINDLILSHNNCFFNVFGYLLYLILVVDLKSL